MLLKNNKKPNKKIQKHNGFHKHFSYIWHILLLSTAFPFLRFDWYSTAPHTNHLQFSRASLRVMLFTRGWNVVILNFHCHPDINVNLKASGSAINNNNKPPSRCAAVELENGFTFCIHVRTHAAHLFDRNCVRCVFLNATTSSRCPVLHIQFLLLVYISRAIINMYCERGNKMRSRSSIIGKRFGCLSI